MASALITGASGGIGECFARALAARQQSLVLIARSGDKLQVLAEDLAKQHSVKAECIALDLSAPGAAAKVVAELGQRHTEIDLLVNNAGFGAQGKFWEASLERQSAIIDLNIKALLELTHLLLPPMVQKRAGGIINVSSTASFQPLPYTAVYAASKAFVTSFSMGLAEELRPYGVKVVTLCPGTTRTNFFEAGGYKKLNFRISYQSPEAVASAGLRRLERGGGLVLSRPIDNVTVFAERLLPRSWLARLTAGLFRV